MWARGRLVVERIPVGKNTKSSRKEGERCKKERFPSSDGCFFVETSSTKFLQNIWRTHNLLIQLWSPLCHWRRFILGSRKFESTWLPDMKVICYRYKRGGDTSLPRNFFNTSDDGWHNISRGRINVIFGSIEKLNVNVKHRSRFIDFFGPKKSTGNLSSAATLHIFVVKPSMQWKQKFEQQ